MNAPHAPPASPLRLRLRPQLMLVVGISTACVIAGGASLALRYFEGRLIHAAEQATVADGDELRGVFEAEMLLEHQSDGGPVRRLVEDVGRAPGTEWVGVVDVHGTVKISSVRDRRLWRFPPESPEAASLAAWRDGTSQDRRVVLRPSPSLLRILAPLPNVASCQRCHGATSWVNGMLVIDRSLTPIRETMARARRDVAIAGVIGVALLLGVLGLVIERIILRRLDRLQATARRLGAGDLSARARDDRPDELGDLARDVDEMAGQLGAALSRVASQRRQLDEIVNGISDGIVVLDPERRVLTSNLAFDSRAGGALPPGTSYAELLRKAGVEPEPASPTPVERALVSGKLEAQVFLAAGGERVEELYAQPLHDADGRVSGVIEVWRDITERRALELNLERSERLAALGVLASSVAHEVGNPLAAIITAVDGLIARVADCPDPLAKQIREYLEMARRQVFRCRTVTERLLGFSRVPGETAIIVDVAAAAANVVALVQPQATKQGVEIELRSPAVVLALAPDMLLEQVFLNIVLNALRAMPSGGRLLVEVAERDGTAVSFSDTGGGIPEKMLKHLFQAFRRAPDADGAGTGLGLFISHSLLDRIGGTIEVDTRAGQGTTFTVRLLPVAASGTVAAGGPNLEAAS